VVASRKTLTAPINGEEKMNTDRHFLILMLVSGIIFVCFLAGIQRSRGLAQSPKALFLLLAKAGTALSLPVWIYYGIPATITLVLPPLILRIRGPQLLVYLVGAFAMAPTIHVVFSLALGWHEYLPFWYIGAI
jgi:hypothetical protein